MASFLNLDDEENVFKITSQIKVQKRNVCSEENYCITIFPDKFDDTIKMTLVNTKNEQESYTSILTRDAYNEKKTKEKLRVDFESLTSQMESILSNMPANNITIQLKVDETVELGFHRMSEFKELTLLILDFQITSTDDVIVYFKKKANDVARLAIRYREDIAQLENKLQTINDKHEEELNIMKAACEEKCNKITLDLNDQTKYRKEIDELRELLSKTYAQRDKAESDVCLLKQVTMEQTNENIDLRNDMMSLKTGIEYYIAKVDTLKDLMEQKDKTTVSSDKYYTLNNMFSKAVADLLKFQVHLKKILPLHDLQKTENSALKEELLNCIQTIKEMEKSLDKDQRKKITNEPNLLKIEELTEMLQNLDKQKESVDRVNAVLNKKINKIMKDLPKQR